MKRIIILALSLSLVLCGSAFAGARNGGLAASFTSPKGDYGNAAGNGYGLSLIFDYPMAGMIDITGTVGWYKFTGVTLSEGTNIKTDSNTLWEFAAGPQIDFGLLYAGAEFGYYTDLDEWGLVPNLGVRKDLLDFSLRYMISDTGEFMAVRAGFFF